MASSAWLLRRLGWNSIVRIRQECEDSLGWYYAQGRVIRLLILHLKSLRKQVLAVKQKKHILRVAKASGLKKHHLRKFPSGVHQYSLLFHLFS